MGKVKVRFTTGTRGYSGSLCQVSADEDPIKGFLVWDTNNKEVPSRFIPVENPYKVVNISIKEPEDIQKFLALKGIEKTTRFRVSVETDLTKAEQEQLKTTLATSYGIEELPRINAGTKAVEKSRQENKEILVNYSDKGFQKEIIADWLDKNGYGESYLDECLTIHDYCSSQVSIDVAENNSQWRLVSAKWDNFGIYGSGNWVNFTELNGIVGLFAPNMSGKSTILEIIVFLMTGETIRNITQAILINDFQSKASGEIIVERNGIQYKIERKLTRTKSGASGKVSFYKWDETTAEWKDENRDGSTATSNYIAELFGTHKDLLYTAISGQEKFAGLVDAKRSERKETLYRFYNLSFFEELEKVAKKEIESLQKELKTLQKSANSEMYNQMLKTEETKKQFLENVQKEIVKLKEENSQLQTTLENYRASINVVTQDVSINDVQRELAQAKAKLASIQQTRTSVTSKKQSDINASDKIKEEIRHMLKERKAAEIKDKLNEVQELENKKSSVVSSQRVAEEKNKTIQRSLTILGQQDWFNDSELCKKCMFLADAWKAKDESEKVTSLVDKYKQELQEINDKLGEIGFSSSEILRIQDYVNKFSTIKKNLELYEAQLSQFDAEEETWSAKIITLQQTLEDHAEIIKVLSENESISKKIDETELKKKIVERTLTQKEQEQIKIAQEIGYVQGQTKTILEQINRGVKLEESQKYYKAYMECVSKDGIPFEVIRLILPKINTEVNQIIGQTQNWKVEISSDKDNVDINLVVERNGEEKTRPIESGSGAQRIITSLAIRIALSRLSLIPRPTFFIVDEGFNSLDEAKVQEVEVFLDNMKKYFDFVMVISHVPQMQEKVDMKILIENDGEYSTVQHGTYI